MREHKTPPVTGDAQSTNERVCSTIHLPLRRSLTIPVMVPCDMTQHEADRICHAVRSMVVEKKGMLD